ncbi:MAG TPA: hypothetical protein VI612_04800 [Candidatus Nanoarchaeia archaeon]|nr:hypothetical protein [Candidatus Nanoarchaeia archaeon]
MFQFTYPTGGERLRAVFTTLQGWGFQDFILPTILIFAIIFAILQKVAIFKVKKGANDVPDRKINGILALAIAMLIVIPHTVGYYPPEMDPIRIINQFLPNTMILLVAIVLSMILIGLVAKDKPPQPIHFIMGLIAIIALLAVIIKAAFPAFVPRWAMDQNTQALIIVLLTMALVAWFVMSPPREPTAAGQDPYKRLKGWFGHP